MDLKSYDTIELSKTSSGDDPKKKIFLIKKMNVNLILNSPILFSYIDFTSSPENIVQNFNIDPLIDRITSLQKGKCLTRHAFHRNFIIFTQILQLQNLSRKSHIDSILKKCKTKFFKALKSIFKKLFGKYSKNICKLPRKFVSDIRINCNKKYLDLSLFEIFKDYKININLIEVKLILTDYKFKMLLLLLNKTYKALYIEYINSRRFLIDCEKICKKEGKKYELLFKYVSKFFVNYYTVCFGNKTIKK